MTSDYINKLAQCVLLAPRSSKERELLLSALLIALDYNGTRASKLLLSVQKRRDYAAHFGVDQNSPARLKREYGLPIRCDW